ncbi:hypothetical protein A4G28_08810 [Mycobacterium ostraviense]|uniref:RDD domain-containing protein n=2 Tax=Mycobacterium ostraviense TaxID=2738409 RepID=A0A163XXT8_9MYCO|nr:hypothetical protein A4G28_08810 [Mycobacterium ostraviense]
MDGLPMEAYASWIRRVAAYLIDHMLGLAIGVALGIVGGLIVAWAGGGARLQGVVGLIVNLAMLAYWVWNWGFRRGITGSTVGKSVLKFRVLSERTGAPIGVGSSIGRYFAHILDAITFDIGYLLPLLTAKRQTIADMVMDTVCLLDEPPQVPSSRQPRPRPRMALGVVVLAIAAMLTVLACLNTTSHWVCTGGGRYPHCGPQVSVGPISYGAPKVFDPYVQAALVTPLWTAGIFILRRYYRATYVLVPIAGIVSTTVFAQGRYEWGWRHNWFAFLACVGVTTAVCVLIARSITRSVAARRA